MATEAICNMQSAFLGVVCMSVMYMEVVLLAFFLSLLPYFNLCSYYFILCYVPLKPSMCVTCTAFYVCRISVLMFPRHGVYICSVVKQHRDKTVAVL